MDKEVYIDKSLEEINAELVQIDTEIGRIRYNLQINKILTGLLSISLPVHINCMISRDMISTSNFITAGVLTGFALTSSYSCYKRKKELNILYEVKKQLTEEILDNSKMKEKHI